MIESLTEAEAERIRWDWDFWEQPHQVEPAGPWRWWFFKGGRGSGKTRTGSQKTIERAMNPPSPGATMLIGGRTAGDLRDAVVEGESGLLACAPPWFRLEYQPSKSRIVCQNGVIMNLRSGDQPDGFRGLQWYWAWLDEFAAWRYAERALYEGIEPGGRLGPHPAGMITSTPRSTHVIRKLAKRPDVAVTHGTSYDNEFLAREVMRGFRELYEGTTRGRQEMLAEIIEDNPAAQWKIGDIDAARVRFHPSLDRVVVGVDPATTYGEKSDETGIVVAGRGPDRHGYVLEDVSVRAKPQEWAARVVSAYHRYNANLIVVEVNNGGDLVEAALRQIEPSLPIKKIQAKHAKRVRAEPVAMLYEQRKVHHVGTLSELESQMVTTELGLAGEPDDRIDALVYALTEIVAATSNGYARFAAMA